MVDDVSHKTPSALLGQEGVSCQALKNWKVNTDPDVEANKNRAWRADLSDHQAKRRREDPVVIGGDEFGSWNLQSHPGK